jgi:hypothetical protein
VAGLKLALIVTARDRARDLVRGMPALHEHAGLLGLIAAEAAFDYGDPWLDAVIDQLDHNREQLARGWHTSCPRSTAARHRPPTSPGWTARTSGSVRTPRRPFCTTAESRSAAVWTMDPRELTTLA